ncbi:MAG: single-stranded DNA-binding protein [Actinobacteria bacterium]|nr:single-stranded DNA-binding protein [Actinomycetota bacterium]
MNVLSLTGVLAADPVRRDTNKGVVCEFRLAVDSRPRLWIVVQTWGQLAGRCAQHLTSGRHVAVSGQLLCEEYVTRAGERATRWFSRATAVTFLDRPTHETPGAQMDEVAP